MQSMKTAAIGQLEELIFVEKKAKKHVLQWDE